MRLFRRKRKRKEVTPVPLPMLLRQVVYDTLLMPPEGIAEKIGLPPVSEEVSEMEEKASQARLNRMGALLPFIDAHADISAKIASAAYLLEEKEAGEEPTNIQLEEMHDLFRLVSLSASLSCVSTLFSLGLIDSKVVGDDDEY